MPLEMKSSDFWLPSLDEVADAVRPALKSNYREVEVSVETCPDLRRLGCAFSGLGGAPFLIEIGGEPYVHNPKYRSEGTVDLAEIGAACGRPGAKILGAGFPALEAMNGHCGELMPCLVLNGGSVSKVARVGQNRECIVEDYPSQLHGGLGNLYACDGTTTDVLKIWVRIRTGDEASFTQTIRGALLGLTCGREGREIAMGGVFSVLAGRVRAHVSPDYDCIPFRYYDEEREEVIRQDFLQFYEGMGPDLMCMAVFWTGDPTGGALNLRPTHEHTHFFSTAGRPEGGHYHYDVSPDSISYSGYFHLAEQVVRVNDIYAKLEARS